MAPEISLSTVWAQPGGDAPAQPHGDPAARARAVAEAIESVGLRAIEVEYRFGPAALAAFVAEMRPRGLRAVSVHNFTPIPEGLAKGSGDAFNLAAVDREERLLAVRHTLRTLEIAHDLEAGAVVLHLGWVEGLEDKEATRQAARAGGMTPRLDRLLELRAEQAHRHVDAASRALDRLIPRAEALGVTLGLENRFHAFQVPDHAEMKLLLERFAGAPVAPWFDAGHAWAQGQAGLEGQEAWLDAFGPRLLGCHLHDAEGAHDHQLPGQGDMDWPWLMGRLADCPRQVLELQPGPAPEAVAEAAAWLASLRAAA